MEINLSVVLHTPCTSSTHTPALHPLISFNTTHYKPKISYMFTTNRLSTANDLSCCKNKVNIIQSRLHSPCQRSVGCKPGLLLVAGSRCRKELRPATHRTLKASTQELTLSKDSKHLRNKHTLFLLSKDPKHNSKLNTSNKPVRQDYQTTLLQMIA